MKASINLTKESISRSIFKLGIPIILSMVMQTLYIMIDLFFVGKLGAAAVAAISISGNSFFIIFGISLMIGIGAMALIAQAYGREDYFQAEKILYQSLILGTIAGIFIAIAGFSVAVPYIKFFGGHGDSLSMGVSYFRIFSISSFFLLLIFIMNSDYRGMGNAKIPMVIMARSTLINIILDPILIFGFWKIPALGVKGAAIASLIAQIYAVVFFLYRILFVDSLITYKFPLKLDIKIVRRILYIGLPSGLNYFLLSFNLFITYKVVSICGTQALASLGIGFRILQSIYLPVVAISSAIAAIVGQNFGAKNYLLIKKTLWLGWKLSFGIMIFGTLLCWLFPKELIGIFSKDAQVIQYGVTYLKIMSLGNILVGTIMAVSAVFQGLGMTMPTLLGALIDNLLFAGLVFSLPDYFSWSIVSVWWIKLGTAFIETVIDVGWLKFSMQQIYINFKK